MASFERWFYVDSLDVFRSVSEATSECMKLQCLRHNARGHDGLSAHRALDESEGGKFCIAFCRPAATAARMSFDHCLILYLQQDCYALRDVTLWQAERLGVSVEHLLVRFAVIRVALHSLAICSTLTLGTSAPQTRSARNRTSRRGSLTTRSFYYADTIC